MQIPSDLVDLNTLTLLLKVYVVIIIFIIYLFTGVPAHELQLNNIVLLGQAVLPSCVI